MSKASISKQSSENFNKYYISFIIFSLVICIGFSITLITTYLDNDIDRIQKNALKQKLSAATLTMNQYLKNQLTAVQRLAALPLITNAVMDTNIDPNSFKLFIDSFNVHGEDQYLAILNYDLDYIYSRDAGEDIQDTENTPWLQALINDTKTFHIRLVTHLDKDFLEFAVPIYYRGYPEGIVISHLNFDFDDIFSTLLDNAIIKFSQGPMEILSSNDDFKKYISDTSVMDRYNFDVTIYEDTSKLLSEELNTKFKISLIIIMSVLASFFLIFLMGRKFLLKPIYDLEQSRAEISKANQELQLFKSIISNANDIIIVTEGQNITPPHGPKIIYVNDRFCDLTGFTREEIIGKTPRVLQGENTSRDTLKEIFNALVSKNGFNGELLNYTKNGKPYWIEASIFPIYDESHDVQYYAAVERDIDERKQNEETLKKVAFEMELLNLELESAKDDAETANKLKSEFLARAG